MSSLLDRILRKLSIDALFSPFGLQINKLGEKKRENDRKGKKMKKMKLRGNCCPCIADVK